MYNTSEQDLLILRQAYEVLGRILGSQPGCGLPASAPALVQNSTNRRAEKKQQRVKACMQNLEKHLGSGFTQFVNLSKI